MRGGRHFLGSVLIAFGVVSALVQFVGQLFPNAFSDPGFVTTVTLMFCLAYGIVRSWPKRRVRRTFMLPEMSVSIVPGDLFDEPGHLVVGFSDTFDTCVAGGVPVNGDSVQGQLLRRRYGGDVELLDEDLEAGLRRTRPLATEERTDKPVGKLDRYPIGTVAVLGERPRLVFAVAYSRFGNDCVAESGVEELWFSLNRLWDAVYRHGQHEGVAMPLIGDGLSRVDFLDPESLLRLVLLSFVTRSRERRICRELRIVLRPEVFRRIDLREAEAFLNSLGSGPSRS
ncbi:MAG: hypothetical protein AUG49_03235 [Catenulispora sp. 13_1_20CM_3_70_7]|nr:hypothetical protein [Catenulisporales bacterium]OLE28145.1 MAG: hypothetical protein AUG49_03235 [Catenulispora sp. 13_1_20CM_3_70_7]